VKLRRPAPPRPPTSHDGHGPRLGRSRPPATKVEDPLGLLEIERPVFDGYLERDLPDDFDLVRAPGVWSIPLT
jgi:hypothetical protein